jgi:hypothetical protein
MNVPSPIAGPEVYVRPPAVPGAGGGTGTPTDPFHSVADAINEVQNGGVVRLHAGHYIESVALEGVSGLAARKILVQPFGDGDVFIDSLLPEFLHPGANDRWDPITPPGGAFNGEYEWRHAFPLPANIQNPNRLRVNGGAFLEEPAHARLVGYSQPGDLRADNQLWPKSKPGPADGNRVWRLDTSPGANGTYIPETRNNEIHRLPSLYMGPGVWFDQRPGARKVHIRLSATTNNIPGWPDYTPATTDPNNVRLALCREEDYAIFLMNCHHITFRDLELRFGNPDTIRLNTCTDIAFDHCRIRSATRAIQLLTGNSANSWNEDIRIEHCVIDGGIPTWFFRSDRKDEYLMGPTNKNRAVKEETFRNRLGSSTSDVQISGTARNRGVIVHHCEIVNAHDSYVFGQDMQFHHNWVHNLNDDGIALSGTAETSNAKIFCNVMTQCLTALSFASTKTLGPVYLYGNLIDIRRPTLGVRRKTAGSTASDSLRQGHFFKDGADEGVIELFHNTCVVLDPGAKGDNPDDLTDAGYSYFVNIGANSQQRRAFNNILVAVYTSESNVRPIAFLAPAWFVTQSDGNTYFRIPEGEAASINFQMRRKIGDNVVESGVYPTLLAYRKDQWPPNGAGGYEEKSVLGNPMFKAFDTATGRPRRGDDLRLAQGSPAKNDVAAMPEDLRDKYSEATGVQPVDRGCYPHTGARLQVGVGGRRIFPFMPPDLGPTTHPDDIPPVEHIND